MTITIIRDCWRAINENNLFNAQYQPLSYIDTSLAYYGLPILQALKVKSEPSTDISTVSPSFKALTDDILFSLRHNIYIQKKLDIVDIWAEKLMRFCEVRYSSLKKRSIIKCETKSAAQLHILHIACFFMDYAFYTKDPRFLNTTLKLSDFKWLLDKRKLLGQLNKNNKDISSVLFQFKIVLTTEYALNQLQEDKKK